MDILKFLEETNKLKQIKRTGWVERGVKEPESVADHSFKVALQAAFLGEGLNIEKLLKMAIIHDLAKSQAGDMISKEAWPAGGTVTKKEKCRLEKDAMEKILGLLNAEMKREFMGLWLELQEEKTGEAVFLKSLCRLETILQAVEYRKQGNFKKPLEPFWDEKGLGFIRDRKIRELAIKAIEEMGR
jgi:putative hydrolase of HD superfamily